MKIFPSQLEAGTCRRICEFAKDQVLKVDENKPAVTMWTNYAWPEIIVKDSTTVLCFVTPSQFLQDIQLTLENLGIFDPETDLPISDQSQTRSICLIYLWTRNSYIPIHRDGQHRKTVTIYCNEAWSFEMGGVFQWFDSENNRWESLIPSCGTVILNDNDEFHATTPVKSNEFRISLQIFLFRKKEES